MFQQIFVPTLFVPGLAFSNVPECIQLPLLRKTSRTRSLGGASSSILAGSIEHLTNLLRFRISLGFSQPGLHPRDSARTILAKGWPMKSSEHGSAIMAGRKARRTRWMPLRFTSFSNHETEHFQTTGQRNRIPNVIPKPCWRRFIGGIECVCCVALE